MYIYKEFFKIICTPNYTNMKCYGIDELDNFLFEKEINEGLSKETIRTYITVFNMIWENPYIKLDDYSTFKEINFKRLLGEYLIKYKWTSHTYNRYRKNLKIYCDYLVLNGYINENPLKNIKIRKVEKSLPKYLDTKQLSQFKKVLNEVYDTDDYMTLRNKTILYFYLFTGLRLYELINLKIEDIDFINGTIRINKGKGNKDRIVPLVNKLGDYLIRYLLKRKSSKIETEILFPTRFKGTMQHRDVYNILNKVKAKLNYKLTPHMFRHTFATELVRKNVNIYNISRVLGHSDLKTTQIYLGLDIKSVNDNLNKVNLFS